MQAQEQTGNENDVSPETNRRFLLVVGLMVVAIISVMLTPKILQLRAWGQLTACKSTMKNIAESVEMYASDNSGKYPPSLDVLVGPQYRLPSVPLCGVGKMTYLDYQVSTEPDNFSFSCCGDNHRAAYAGSGGDSTGYPRYNGEFGRFDPPAKPRQNSI